MPLPDRRFPVLVALGFAAGVPLPLTAFVLRQWLAEEGIALEAIGLTALIGLAYSLKFLWSPVLDTMPPPGLSRMGRRRGWLALIQPALALAILAMGQNGPGQGITTTLALAALIAFLSATQDIAIDALRIEMLEQRSQGYGLACYVWGYRGGMLAANAGALAIAEFAGWPAAFACCAAMVGVGLIAVLAAQEGTPSLAETPSRQGLLQTSVISPLVEFTRRPGWLVILAFVALFKLGEALAGVMTAPFYRDLGFSKGEVATVAGGFGLAATLFGALAGGWLIARLGIGRVLVAAGLAQMLSNLLYVALARCGHDLSMLWIQVGAENFTDGLADAAFLTYLATLTNRSYTATQYALLSSLAAVPLRTVGASSGYLAAWLGWEGFFIATAAAALPAMALMAVLLTRFPGDGGSVLVEKREDSAKE